MKLHVGVINPEGAILSKEQVERLNAALKSKTPRIPGAFCYMPHHGFVFYDKEGKAMGHIEMCFACMNVSSSPAGLPKVQWDWKALATLMTELKIPMLDLKFNELDPAYTKLYLERKAAGEK